MLDLLSLLFANLPFIPVKTAAMSQSSSRTWKSATVTSREYRHRIQKARKHICPRSTFLTRSLDLDNQNQIMREAKHKFEELKHKVLLLELEIRREQEVELGRDLEVKPFGGKLFPDNRGAVLSHETIWCQNPHVVKIDTAPWPSTSEMRYEGDDRVATGVIHGRFLPLPRRPCNETVSWTQAQLVPHYAFDVMRRPYTSRMHFSPVMIWRRLCSQIRTGRPLLVRS